MGTNSNVAEPKFMAYNHNGKRLMREPSTRASAENELREYECQTGNGGFVSQVVLSTCEHPLLHPATFDQTLGVVCPDCDLASCCWADEHVSESLWNRACANDKEAVPCEQNRDDVCFLCGEHFETQHRIR